MKTHSLKDGQNLEFSAFEFGNLTAHPLILVMPGAHCDGWRYEWIGKGLEERGYSTLILDAPEEHRATLFSPDSPAKTKIISIEHAKLIIEYLGVNDQPCILIGHSYGGAVILNDLSQAGISALWGCVIIGTHLQAEAFGRKMPGRSDDQPLHKPPGLPLLFIAGERDMMAPPEKVRETSKRYACGSLYLSQYGANHLNWAEGTGWADRRDLDGEATVDPAIQRQTTLDYILAFVEVVSSSHDDSDAIAKAMLQTINTGDQFERH